MSELENGGRWAPSGFGTVADSFPLAPPWRRTKSASFSANFVVIVASS